MRTPFLAKLATYCRILIADWMREMILFEIFYYQIFSHFHNSNYEIKAPMKIHWGICSHP